MDTIYKVNVKDTEYEVEDRTARKNIESLKADKVSVQTLRDIKNKTPHVANIEEYYNAQRTGKVYQTKIWKFNTNPTSDGIKLLDNEGLEFEPSTDTYEGKDDYLNGENPLFEWCYCNYKRYDDGTAYPIATEFDDNYVTSGSVDVGAMQMSFYWNWDASNPEYDLVTISDMPNDKYGLKPWVESEMADESTVSWCIGSAYISGLASDGLLRSQQNLKPESFQSYSNIITNYSKKGKGYQGAGVERQTFQVLFNIIKGATKNSQKLYQGTVNYNFQYSAAIQSSEKHTYFPVTNSQAENIIVGSSVSVGYGYVDNGKLNNDRNNSNLHKYAKNVRVLKIETLDSNNKAVYLDVADGFTTSPVQLNDTLTSPIVLSSMHWYSGKTNTVKGHHDGSYISNTSGKYPYRVQGREYAVGCYFIASNMAMEFQSDYSKKVYVAKKGIAHTTSESAIRSNYSYIGILPASSDGKGGDFWIGDITVDTKTAAFYPSVIGSSDSQGYGDKVYAGGTSTSGFREFLIGGSLRIGSNAGSVPVSCWAWLTGASWYYGGCD